jgi:hypothetical protein
METSVLTSPLLRVRQTAYCGGISSSNHHLSLCHSTAPSTLSRSACG